MSTYHLVIMDIIDHIWLLWYMIYDYRIEVRL